MPDEFKKILVGTDARGMRDNTADDVHVNTFLLDGDAPRLATPVLPQPSPIAPPPVPSHSSLAPPAPGSAPLLRSEQPTLPMPVLTGQVLPGTVVASGSREDQSPVGENATPAGHPMAHLMNEKAKPSEASLRAAQLRAEKKAKARRTRIIVAVVMLVIAGVVGPPLVRWLIGAINEAGSTGTEEPIPTTAPTAVTDPLAADAASSEATSEAEDPSDDTGGSEGLAGLAELPDAARDVVERTNANGTTDVLTTTVP